MEALTDDRAREAGLLPFLPFCPYCDVVMRYLVQRVFRYIDLECPGCGLSMSVPRHIYQAWAEVGH